MKAGDDAIDRHGDTPLRAALMHPIVWRLALLYFTLIVGFYSISFWSPQIIQSLSGFGNAQVALISAIPYVVAAVAMVIVGAHSDRTRERCRHIAAAAFVGALGMIASCVRSFAVARCACAVVLLPRVSGARCRCSGRCPPHFSRALPRPARSR